MPLINFIKREISCKIVFYGPGLSGKTTNLEVIHKRAPKSKRGDLTAIATEGDRTLFFDYMPLDLGSVAGMNTRFQLYTVPGQPYYNATRRLVLQGADGVVFVADSTNLEASRVSFENLEENLRSHGLDAQKVPIVLQWNKRDMPDALDVEVLDRELNKYRSPTVEAVAVTGEGVFPTLKLVARLVLEKLNSEFNINANRRARIKAKATARAEGEESAAAEREAAERRRVEEQRRAAELRAAEEREELARIEERRAEERRAATPRRRPSLQEAGSEAVPPALPTPLFKPLERPQPAPTRNPWRTLSLALLTLVVGVAVAGALYLRSVGGLAGLGGLVGGG